MMRRIFLIDCPGVVYPSGDSETDIVLKGVVRIENIQNPEDHVPAVLERVKLQHIQQNYGIEKWTDANDFLERLAQKTGRLLKGGEPDISQVARMVLNDWQRGKLPYFTLPPSDDKQSSGQPEEEADSKPLSEQACAEENEEGDESEDGEEEEDEEEGNESSDGEDEDEMDGEE